MELSPFLVFVQSKDSTLEKYHPMSFEKQLFNKLANYKYGILEILAKGKIRVEVLQKQQIILLEKEFMGLASIEMFIPYLHIFRQGIK